MPNYIFGIDNQGNVSASYNKKLLKGDDLIAAQSHVLDIVAKEELSRLADEATPVNYYNNTSTYNF